MDAFIFFKVEMFTHARSKIKTEGYRLYVSISAKFP